MTAGDMILFGGMVIVGWYVISVLEKHTALLKEIRDLLSRS